MKRVGVLAFQGGVIEHRRKLGLLGIETVDVRYPKDLKNIEGIILPGGESTCIRKMLRDFHLLAPLKQILGEGLPAWGTCAGAILLSKQIDGVANEELGFVDVDTQRNAYGSQLNSFITSLTIPEIAEKPLRLVFVRAPKFSRLGNNVQCIASLANKEDSYPIAIREKNFLLTTFHPELAEGCEFHHYFTHKFQSEVLNSVN